MLYSEERCKIVEYRKKIVEYRKISLFRRMIYDENIFSYSLTGTPFEWRYSFASCMVYSR
jgi:hypothetical protein